MVRVFRRGVPFVRIRPQLIEPVYQSAGRQDIFSRRFASCTSAHNSHLRLIFNRPRYRREVHKCPDQHTMSKSGMMESAGAVCRGDEHSTPANCLACVFRWRISQVKALDLSAAPLAAQHDIAALAFRGSRERFFHFQERHDLARPEASAWQMVVDARSRSMTTTTLPASAIGSTFCGKSYTFKIRSSIAIVFVNCAGIDSA